MLLNINSKYSRKENIILENDVPILKLKEKFVDIENLTSQMINYMNDYIKMFPNNIENIKQEQLSLF